MFRDTRKEISKKISELSPTQKAYALALIAAAAVTSGIAIAGIVQDKNSHADAKEIVKLIANLIVQSGAGSLATIFLVTTAMTNTFVTGPAMWVRDKYINWDKEQGDDYLQRKRPAMYQSINNAS